MQITTFLSLALAAAAVTAKPVSLLRRDGSALTQTILKAAPATESCADADFAEECATAAEAGPLVAAAMKRFCIHDTPVVAALVDIMLFESGAFKYNRNHFPGRPGQGTRNMQMIDFNLLYALDIPELKEKAVAIAGEGVTSGDNLSDDKKNEILALVMPNEYSFASAAWFLTTQCEASIREGLVKDGDAGYEKYLTECIGTEAAEERLEHWKTTKAAFGL